MQMGGTKMNLKKARMPPRKGIAVNDIVFFETAEHNNKRVNVSIMTAGTCTNIGRFILYPIIGKITMIT